MTRSSLSSLAIVLTLAAPMVVFGEVTQADIDRLTLERDAAQRLRDIAQAEAEAAKARLGSLDTSELPKGKGEATDLHIEGKILGYRAADEVAGRIADAVRAVNPQSIVLFSEKQLGAVLQYRTYLRQTDLLHEAIDKVSGNDASLPALPPLESDAGDCNGARSSAKVNTVPMLTIGAAVQLLSLFKTDKTLIGKEFDPNQMAFSAAVLGKLRQHRIKVAYPASYLPKVFTVEQDPYAQSTVLKRYDWLMRRQATLTMMHRLISRRIAELKEKASRARGDCKEMYARDVAKLEVLDVNVSTLESTLTQLQTALLKTDDVTGAPVLQTLLVSEALAESFKGAHVLQLNAIAAGGATLAKTSIFSTKFFFSGGFIGSYLLFDGQSGELVSSGTERFYAGFVEQGQLGDDGKVLAK